MYVNLQDIVNFGSQLAIFLILFTDNVFYTCIIGLAALRRVSSISPVLLLVVDLSPSIFLEAWGGFF